MEQDFCSFGPLVSWTEAVNEWFNKGYISSGKILGDNQICIVPGNVENFSFEFSRDLIPYESGIKYEAYENGNYLVSFQDRHDLNEYSKEVFEALRKNSK